MTLIGPIAVAILLGTISSYGGRWQATTLWAGKALASPTERDSAPRGLQDAFMHGPESWLGSVVPVLIMATVIWSFLQAWWAIFVIWLVLGLTSVFAGRMFVPRTVDWYLLRLHSALANRQADFAKKNDHLRAEAARDVNEELRSLYQIYAGSGVAAPNMKQAQQTPHGDTLSLKRALDLDDPLVP